MSANVVVVVVGLKCFFQKQKCRKELFSLTCSSPPFLACQVELFLSRQQHPTSHYFPLKVYNTATRKNSTTDSEHEMPAYCLGCSQAGKRLDFL